MQQQLPLQLPVCWCGLCRAHSMPPSEPPLVHPLPCRSVCLQVNDSSGFEEGQRVRVYSILRDTPVSWLNVQPGKGGFGWGSQCCRVAGDWGLLSFIRRGERLGDC